MDNNKKQQPKTPSSPQKSTPAGKQPQTSKNPAQPNKKPGSNW